MPPKRITVEQGGSYRQKAPQGVLKSTYSALTSPENASVVRSIAMFAGAVALISSSFADSLIGL